MVGYSGNLFRPAQHLSDYRMGGAPGGVLTTLHSFDGTDGAVMTANMKPQGVRNIEAPSLRGLQGPLRDRPKRSSS